MTASEALIQFPFAELLLVRNGEQPELLDEGEMALESTPRAVGQAEEAQAIIELVVGGTRWEILPSSRVLKVGEFTFVFSTEDKAVNLTLTLLASASDEDVGILEAILENIAIFKESEALLADPEAQQGESALAGQAYSTALARGVHRASEGVASGLVVSASYATGAIERVAKMARPAAPTQAPLQISDATKRRFARTERVAGWASTAAGAAVGAVAWVGAKAADGVIWATGLDKPQEPGSAPSTLREVSHAAVSGFSQVWEGMETAGRTVLHSARDNTAGVVREHYGEDAAGVSLHSMNAAGHGFDAFSSVRRLGPRTVAKAAAKRTAKRVIRGQVKDEDKGKPGKQASGKGQQIEEGWHHVQGVAGSSQSASGQDLGASSEDLGASSSAPPSNETSQAARPALPIDKSDYSWT